jgi:hypothetical protein
MKLYKYYFAILLVLTMPWIQNNSAEASTSQLQMTIQPLTCSIDIIDDGINHQAHYSSKICQRALKYSNIPVVAL